MVECICCSGKCPGARNPCGAPVELWQSGTLVWYSDTLVLLCTQTLWNSGTLVQSCNLTLAQSCTGILIHCSWCALCTMCNGTLIYSGTLLWYSDTLVLLCTQPLWCSCNRKSHHAPSDTIIIVVTSIVIIIVIIMIVITINLSLGSTV